MASTTLGDRLAEVRDDILGLLQPNGNARIPRGYAPVLLRLALPMVAGLPTEARFSRLPVGRSRSFTMQTSILTFAQVVNLGRPTGARPRASPRWTHRRTTSASINNLLPVVDASNGITETGLFDDEPDVTAESLVD